ncbi:LysM peptidoglycan-binding domain-containing protein [Agathobaculum sp.]|uniref:LysM peptidoglycan-binding domain-containing protein n=1 Tax=Agathobaculum sp. TaxID=2048138 RepID=UPI002A818D8D|nr:glycosyl hydrolase family 18 protein [Agathobaculum sp.]MDY3619393.1 glycosyl hydrolase family 18 protein [Agathobaculum sp.]
MVIHVVQPGESLYRIAQQYNVPVQYLIQQNELREPNRLTPGQTIVVPQPRETYTVKRGDTLGNIAAQHGTSVMSIWQNNPQLGGADRIYPGQSLVLSFEGDKLGTLAVNGYAYPNIDLRVLRRTLPYLTYLSVFSYGFDTAGRIIPQNADLLTKMARQYQVKPLLVLTTLGEDGQFSGERAHALLRNPAARQTLMESLLQTLQGHGFAGVDVDFEYIPPEDAEAYASFISELRAKLTPEGLTVMVALAPKTSALQRGLLYEAHDYRALGMAADDVLLMTYEWGYTLSAPMAVAPVDKVAQVLNFAVSVVPADKIFMGIPNYGYDWTLPYVQGQSRARSLGNVQAVEQAIQVGAPIQFDETAQTPHYNYWRERAEHEVWFEDARSIRAKLALASEFGLRGVSIWNIMRYFPQLWLVLNQLYNIQKLD